MAPELTNSLEVSIQSVAVRGLLVDSGLDGEVLGVLVNQLDVLGPLVEHGLEVVPEVVVLIGAGRGGWDDRSGNWFLLLGLLDVGLDLLLEGKNAAKSEANERRELR